jgi:hypothetical protein
MRMRPADRAFPSAGISLPDDDLREIAPPVRICDSCFSSSSMRFLRATAVASATSLSGRGRSRWIICDLRAVVLGDGPSYTRPAALRTVCPPQMRDRPRQVDRLTMTISTVIAWRLLPLSSTYSEVNPVSNDRLQMLPGRRFQTVIFRLLISTICRQYFQRTNAWQTVGTDFSQMEFFQRFPTGREVRRPPCCLRRSLPLRY